MIIVCCGVFFVTDEDIPLHVETQRAASENTKRYKYVGNMVIVWWLCAFRRCTHRLYNCCVFSLRVGGRIRFAPAFVY